MSMPEMTRAVVRLWEDPARFSVWAKLDNGLEVEISMHEMEDVPTYEVSGPKWFTIDPIRRAEMALGMVLA